MNYNSECAWQTKTAHGSFESILCRYVSGDTSQPNKTNRQTQQPCFFELLQPRQQLGQCSASCCAALLCCPRLAFSPCVCTVVLQHGLCAHSGDGCHTTMLSPFEGLQPLVMNLAPRQLIEQLRSVHTLSQSHSQECVSLLVCIMCLPCLPCMYQRAQGSAPRKAPRSSAVNWTWAAGAFLTVGVGLMVNSVYVCSLPAPPPCCLAVGWSTVACCVGGDFVTQCCFGGVYRYQWYHVRHTQTKEVADREIIDGNPVASPAPTLSLPTPSPLLTF